MKYSFLITKKAIATTLCAVMAAYAAPANASCKSIGCNIVDDGHLLDLTYGQTLYLDQYLSGNTSVQVLKVDYNSQAVYVQDANGNRGWVYANNLYTKSRVTERDNATAAFAFGAVLLFLLSGGDDGESTSGSEGGGGGQSFQERANGTRSGGSSGNGSSPTDTSAGCLWGDRAYGTC